jgi:hypothetical protein
MSLKDLFSGYSPFEYALTFIVGVSVAYWGLSVNLQDSVKTGIVAVIAIIGSRIISDYITGAAPANMSYDNQSVYDPNEKNMRVIMSDM